MRKWTCVVATVLFLLGGISSQAYQSPGKPTGLVNDYANILGQPQVAIIQGKLNTLQAENGTEIAVVTIKSLDGEPIEDYTVTLFAEWGIGQKGTDNGLLLLIAVEDREMRIEVGYGLEGTITDAQAYWIIRDVITPAFRNDDYFDGIDGAVDKITEAITGATVLPSATEDQSQSGQSSSITGETIIYILIGLNLLGMFLGMTKSVWLGGVIGFVAGFFVGIFTSTWMVALGLGMVGSIIGLIIDAIYSSRGGGGSGGWTSSGGSGRSSSGGGFGGFGGGSSGGGGASGRW